MTILHKLLLFLFIFFNTGILFVHFLLWLSIVSDMSEIRGAKWWTELLENLKILYSILIF